MYTDSNNVVDQREILRYIQNGRLYYYEPKLRAENHPVINQTIVKFREWRVAFEASHVKPDATDLPQKYIDLIAVLVHDSDEHLEALCQRINALLSPFDRNEGASIYFYHAIEQIIKAVAYRERYGLADIVTLLNNGTTTSIPSRFSIYRWQAHDMTNFPSEVKDIALKRRELRKVMSRNFTDAFQSLDKSKRMLLLDERMELSDTKKKTCHIHIDDMYPAYTKDDYLPPPPKTRKTDLKHLFLNDLSPSAKLKRGTTSASDIDFKKIFTQKRPSHALFRKIRALPIKLIQFHENVRPAYYGTWTKHSDLITGRTPFAKDETWLDYDYDSEAEWELDEGDDIHSLVVEDDDELAFPESEDEDGKSNQGKWLVPEGYLSEDEGLNEKQSRVVGRPVKLPALRNKHFSMEQSIQGPFLESQEHDDEDLLVSFKYQLLIDIPPEGYSPLDMSLVQEEDEKSITDDKEQLCDIILRNKYNSVNGIVEALKAHHSLNTSTNQEIHTILTSMAVQESRDSQGFRWFIRE
ncbi:hypothetical protein K501DRAFT_336654 [Backusella circina FSU 941]|nr:hypothetical protein K501DRAFT_336654 [Backusella circina FSU 941]